MKKIVMILVVLGLFTLPSIVLAASGTVYSGILEMGDIDDSDFGTEVSLSPSVSAVYIQPVAQANATTAQWYAIGAGHPGGTKVYATAQNITNIWTKGITDATELTTVLGEIPESQVSETDWSDNSWEK